MMVGGQSYAAGSGSGRPWTFYALATLFGLFLLFLYGPMLVMYILSFQGPHGGVTFPIVGFSTVWFDDIVKPGQMANNHHAFPRSALHGLRWWQFDLSGLTIRALERIRLIGNVQRVSPAQLTARGERTILDAAA